MSRPKLPSARLKSRIVSFRLTDAEYTRLAHKTAAANLRVNELARLLALSKTDRLILKTYAQHDPALIQQLLHLGHNLNQLTKNAHIFGRVSPQVTQLCTRIERIIDEAIHQQGGA